VVRVQAGLSVVRFCTLLGMPRATWYRWRGAVAGGTSRPGKGPGPRRSWTRSSRWRPSTPSSGGPGATARSGRCSRPRASPPAPPGSAAPGRGEGCCSRSATRPNAGELAAARRAVFLAPPTRRNRVWQHDFSELESLAGGIWRLGGVVDYWAKVALACPVTTTQGHRDAVAAVEAAIGQAGLLLGCSLLDDCTDPATGELTPVVLVTDNGPAYRSASFARFIAGRPELAHVRTRHRAPQTNGVVERFYQAIKYEDLYRHEVGDGLVLAQRVAGYLTVYNTIRPHEAIGFTTPLAPLPASPVHPASGQPSPARNRLRFLTRDSSCRRARSRPRTGRSSRKRWPRPLAARYRRCSPRAGPSSER
jgi:putative transposase